MHSKGRIVISKMGVAECFDTCLDAQSADSKVTIDIQLNFSEQRAHFYVPGQKEPDVVRLSLWIAPAFATRRFLSHVMTCVANCQDNCKSRMDPSSLCRLRRQCVLRLKRYVGRQLDRDWERTSRTSSRSRPMTIRWSIVCRHSRVETRAVRATSCQTVGR